MAFILLAGCSSSDVTLESRPTDADSAEELAKLVAEKARCGSFEYYNDTKDHWTFTCQSGESGQNSYKIRVVRDESAKRANVEELGDFPPVKAGAYFLVQAARNVDGSAAGSIEQFPGENVDATTG